MLHIADLNGLPVNVHWLVFAWITFWVYVLCPFKTTNHKILKNGEEPK